jgi:hypothetical protein
MSQVSRNQRFAIGTLKSCVQVAVRVQLKTTFDRSENTVMIYRQGSVTGTMHMDVNAIRGYDPARVRNGQHTLLLVLFGLARPFRENCVSCVVKKLVMHM